MIIIPAHALWTLLGIWLAVCICTFMFGWYASVYRHGEAEAERKRAVRRHPSTRFQPDHLPQAGRLPLDAPYLITETVRQPDPAQWWPALERHARADTAPFSAVEVSNWEARLKRESDAWLHERGLNDEYRPNR